jgi:phytoene dehydrogenase-like protein
MPHKYYDVVVIGRSIGALAAAALLARRDFTVLVLGQRPGPSDDRLDGRRLRRAAFTMLAGSSPAWRRLVGELAYTQTWNRRLVPVAPMLQALLPGRRLEVPPDPALFVREIEREFPEVRRLVADLYANFARVTAAADNAFERDAVWPPGSFLERRETGRIAATLPYARGEQHADLLAEFPRHHLYRRIVTESVRFASDLATPPPAFATARLHGAWTRALAALEGGEAELEQLLLERIEANGGTPLLDERAGAIEVKRHTVSGIVIDGDSAPTGAGWIITDLTGEEVAALAGGRGIRKRAQREWPRVVPTTGRFVVSLVAKGDGVPEPLGREAFIFPSSADPGAPVIHLQRAAGDRDDEQLLVAEVLRTERDRLPLADTRAWLVDRLCQELPYLDRHLVLVDSAHDGLPVWSFEGVNPESPSRAATTHRLPRALPAPHEIDRSTLLHGSRRPEPMERQLEVDPPGFLGVGGEPLRGPIERTLLVGASVLPGLGQEGRILAAWGAARVVAHSDKRKARMRREMWTKIEIS